MLCFLTYEQREEGLTQILELLAMLPEDQKGKVPYRAWAEVILTFLQEGFIGLTRLGQSKKYAPLVLGALQELRQPESGDVLATIIRAGTVTRLEALSTANDLFALRNSILAAPVAAETIRQLAHDVLQRRATDDERAMAMYALRGLGTEVSLGILT